jgi:hypothetical protein
MRPDNHLTLEWLQLSLHSRERVNVKQFSSSTHSYCCWALPGKRASGFGLWYCSVVNISAHAFGRRADA